MTITFQPKVPSVYKKWKAQQNTLERMRNKNHDSDPDFKYNLVHIKIIEEPIIKPILYMVIDRVEWGTMQNLHVISSSNPDFFNTLTNLQKYTVIFKTEWKINSTTNYAKIYTRPDFDAVHQCCDIDTTVIPDEFNEDQYYQYYNLEFVPVNADAVILCISDDIDMFVYTKDFIRPALLQYISDFSSKYMKLYHELS